MSKKLKKIYSKKKSKKFLTVESSLAPVERPLDNFEETTRTEQEQMPPVQTLAQPVRSAKLVRVAALFAIFAMAAAAVVYTLPRASTANNSDQLTLVHGIYDATVSRVEALQAKQAAQGRVVIDDKALQAALIGIQSDTSAGHLAQARRDIAKLNRMVSAWQDTLSKPAPTPQPAPNIVAKGIDHQIYAPILLYHHPPVNMERQFQHLVDHGYVTVSLQQIADAQNGKGVLPAKPVVITFDDGFADQMPMLDLLKKYNLKAVFYIINGGQGSNFHIGANKKANDPEGGDAYLSWDQIRVLDQSGFAEIAAHTMNHLDLAKMTPDVQRFEIIEGKHYLEEKLGHIVTDFCFPYGAFNQSAINIVKEAGFTTATTTLPGTDQSVASPFTMRRVRDALILP